MVFDKLFNFHPKEVVNPVTSRPYGETNIGRYREKNEDAILIFDRKDIYDKVQLHGVYAVADGVGGQPNGEIASHSLISLIFDYASAGKYIHQEELQIINSQIESGGTTLVLAQQSDKDQNVYDIFSVGDSSALVLDQKLGTLTEITRRDENSVGHLTQAMGPDTGNSFYREANQCSVTLKKGQTLLLATDGFTGYIDKGKFPPSEILKLRKKYPDESNFVRALIEQTNSLGGTDNITIISIPYRPQ
ncbi:MAG: protein phosphatase 2C domain-containing protein [Candidatus Shapirobacteria bacterium]|nr:protein phosphatase 2C domain-containing protein [Candidatus Shapirobacteria bacterium]